MILDTTFVIDVWDGDASGLERLELLERERVQQQLSAMTLFELHHGVARSSKPATEKRRVLEVAESKPILPADGPVMSKAGRLHGDLQREGRPIGESDCIVAATAIVHDEPVLTRNVEHFERVDGVDVRTY